MSSTLVPSPPAVVPTPVPPPDRTPIYLGVVGGVLALVIIAIVVITTFGPPGRDNNPTILLIVGIVAPTIASILALLKGSENATGIKILDFNVNSRLTQLLNVTSVASRAEGVIAGQATPIPITPEQAAANTNAALLAIAAAIAALPPASPPTVDPVAGVHPPDTAAPAG